MSRRKILRGKAHKQTIVTEKGKASTTRPSSRTDKQVNSSLVSYVRVRGTTPSKGNGGK